MTWREKAIEVVLECEFCTLWGSLNDKLSSRKDERARRERITLRTVELERLSDDALLEEAVSAASSRGYDRGMYDESYLNSMYPADY